MLCTTCGRELDPQGVCANCATAALLPGSTSAPDQSFLPMHPQVKANPFKTAVFTLLSVAFFALVLLLNYLRALRWAGVMNAESGGYMMGGVIFSSLIGFLGVYAVKRVRGRQITRASRALGITGIALLFSIVLLAREFATLHGKSDADIYRHIGALFKEAAGKQPTSGDAHWTDAVIREFIQDIMEMNQHYAAEVAALDRSAIKNLYSTDSYAGLTHMKKVVVQLEAALAVDERYASVDSLIKRMENRVAAANASETDKRDFLNGMQSSLPQGLAPRYELVRKEEEWTKSAIALYEFLIAHTDEYSIRDNKLYFNNLATRKEFMKEQSNSIRLRKEVLKARKAMLDNRNNKMGEVGLSPSDFSPAQLGQQK